MTAVGDARKRQQEAQAPASQPIPAPVDSGAIGRLNETQERRILRHMPAWTPGHVLADLLADVSEVVREHTDRALAEVERAIATSVSPNFALRRDGSEDPQAAAYVEGLHDAHEIVRAARQEQGR